MATFDHFLKPALLMTVISKIMEHTTSSEACDPPPPSNLFPHTSLKTFDKVPVSSPYLFLFRFALSHRYFKCQNGKPTVVIPKCNLVFSENVSPSASQRGVDNKKTSYLRSLSVSTFHFEALWWKVAVESDSSSCHGEQSRCHSSGNTLNTDLFSPDKWT